MKYRTFRGTDVRVSEIGFGLWTVSTGWWGIRVAELVEQNFGLELKEPKFKGTMELARA